ncbi:MAG: tRNA (adenosine(37)-N6)-threonylcarbamoyltransferase complex dimerization subunit type 1 TsaB [Lachnospiraceae bacterium]|nr:tRNA (adenosine(37)-N6)-threonylcarbamoyltransferase complex dimerization subunit type 1 TsaB [Lachnospiraceae bacterium]
MKILGIESSGLVASVAVLEEGIIQGEFTTNFKKTHSQTLLPMLDILKDTLELDLDTVDAIAVAAGPGSFTGLRIGSATAKGVALAMDKPIIAVPTLEAMACNFYGSDKLICPIMDARRNQVFTGLYRFENDDLDIVMDQCPLDINELLDKINQLLGDGESAETDLGQIKEVVFLGDGVNVQRQTIEDNCKVKYSFAPAHLAYQSASSLCVRAVTYYNEGKAINSDDFRPEYLRVSQAERERTKKLAAEGGN